MKIGEHYFQRQLTTGTYPIFSLELNRRVKNKEACVVCVVGEAGSGKSYLALQLARNIDKRFGIDQVVFTYSDYVKELGRKKHGIPIVFDEPSYAMGKREWYKEINQALVKTIESQRFLVRPLIIPIININLLDKTLRDYLVIFQVHMSKRGKALVYRIRASQGEDKIYRYLVCKLEYPILDADKCSKDTCLDCNKMYSCPLLRAQYECKKETTQLARYEQDQEKAKTRESREITDDQLCAMMFDKNKLTDKPFLDECREDGEIKARLLRIIFYNRLQIKIGHNKSQILKSLLEFKEKNETA